MSNESSTIPLFSIPLYRSNSTAALDEALLEFTKSLAYVSQNNSGLLSESNQVLDLPAFGRLKIEINSEIKKFTQDVLGVKDEVTFYITTSWINLHNKGDYAPKHYHKNSLLSGVYYLQAEQECGDIVFERNYYHRSLFPSELDLEFKESHANFFNSSSFFVTPKRGDLLLFPSFLEHRVEPSASESPRYSLAFNVFIKGVIDNDDGTSFLRL
jgi:uncharacterized protein (TIGR02466 family)